MIHNSSRLDVDRMNKSKPTHLITYNSEYRFYDFSTPGKRCKLDVDGRSIGSSGDSGGAGSTSGGGTASLK